MDDDQAAMTQPPSAESNVLVLHVSPSTRAMISRTLMLDLGGEPLSEGHKETLASRAEVILRRCLPASDVAMLTGFRGGNGMSLLIRGLFDPGPLPPTPVLSNYEGEDVSSEAHIFWFDAILLGLYRMIGVRPSFYSFENDGRMVRDVVAKAGFEHAASSWGSLKDLEWHQDNNFLPMRTRGEAHEAEDVMPRYLGFIALRNQERVATNLLPVGTVLAKLPARIIETLMTRNFLISTPESVGRNDAAMEPKPLLLRAGNIILSRIDMTEGVRGTTAEAAAALSEFRKTVGEVVDKSVDMCLSAGDCLVFDNYRVLHNRAGFKPHKQAGQSRWLRRIYGTPSDSGRTFNAL